MDNLEIFYTDEIAFHYVEELGDYFEKNNLIQSEKHSVQLTSTTSAFVLKMILNEDYDRLPLNQRRNFELLEQDIQQQVFKGANFKLEICDINFNPIAKQERE